MAPTDKLLSLDMGTHDCLYRFRRDFEPTSTVIYVHLQNLDIIAQDRQTYGPEVIQDLRSNVEVWDQQWTTLSVFRQDGRVQYTQDEWKPHSLPPDAASGNLPRLNVLDLKVLHGFKNRVSLVKLDTQRQILKICPFKYQLQYLTKEIKTYNTLSERGCSLIPRLSAYVFERTEDQIIGFLCEEFIGRVAGPDDYDECKHSLLKLHSYGVVHGDLNKFNIIITASGARFFDLEKSVLDTDEGISKNEFSRLQQEEVDRLEEALYDKEGWGKPWPELQL
ncbi:hypothetical protein B7494_g6074 [Chlorociboria aeruginascens]|nr:hypothetical protein B7494_g6074 [Chlorociboria aeruginascens]